MYIKLLKIDESDSWILDDCPHKERIKGIYGVYVFDPLRKVYLCEMTPSYECHMLGAQVDYHDYDSMEEGEAEAVEDWIRTNEDWSEQVIYFHFHLIDSNAKPFKEGWIPEHSMGVTRMWGFATDFKSDETDQKKYENQRTSAAIKEATEYCAENGV